MASHFLDEGIRIPSLTPSVLPGELLSHCLQAWLHQQKINSQALVASAGHGSLKHSHHLPKLTATHRDSGNGCTGSQGCKMSAAQDFWTPTLPGHTKDRGSSVLCSQVKGEDSLPAPHGSTSVLSGLGRPQQRGQGKGAQSQEIVGGKEKIKGLIHVALVKGQGAWAQGNG